MGELLVRLILMSTVRLIYFANFFFDSATPRVGGAFEDVQIWLAQAWFAPAQFAVATTDNL
jgi:hypothetical protein